MPRPPAGPPARRLATAVLAAVVVLAGVGIRTWDPAPVAGPAGDALYATLVVALLTVAWPRLSPTVAGLLGWAASTGVELLQLTGLPAALVERVPVARYALGTTFVAADVAWYALGALIGALAVAGVRGRPATPQVRHTLSPHATARRRLVPALVAGVLAVVVAAGCAAAAVTRSEAEALRAALPAARAALADSAGRVDDEDSRTVLAATLAEADALLDLTPLVGRRPGDAVDARQALDAAVSTVAASRLAHAESGAQAARTALAPLTAHGSQVVGATDGLGAPDDVRAALVDALTDADAAVAASTALSHVDPDRADDVEAATADLTSSATTVHEATLALLTAQDAVTCPYPDQTWFPQSGRLADADLAAVPWAPEFRVRADVLPSLVELNAAFRAQFGQDLRLNSAYRSLASQQAVYDPAHPNPLAAPPGCSNHGLGTAIDIAGISAPGSTQFAWLDTHAGSFGWVNPDWARPTGRLPEPWHWQHASTPTTY